VDILTSTQEIPPKFVQETSGLQSVNTLITLGDWITLAEHGIYRHETEPGQKGHIGYSPWILTSDAEGPLYTRYPVADVTALGEAPFGYTAWELRQDDQGRDYYFREPIGTQEEREAAHFSARKTDLMADLYRRRVQAEKSPFLHDGRRYDGGDDSIERFGVISQQITWALMAGQPAEATVLQSGWRDVEGEPGPTTIGGLQALLMSHYQHGVACELNSQQIKAAINAAATVDDLDAIDLDADWP